jgi:hypothetical protein
MQEWNLQDGRALNRMSLTDTVSVTINFNSDRIQMIRAYNPTVPAKRPFVELAVELLESLSAFGLRANRCVLVHEKLMAEGSLEKLRAIRLKHLVDDGKPEPMEWFLRTTELKETSPDFILTLMEVSRLQGTIQVEGQMTTFDRIRYKSEIGTDMRNQENRFAIPDLIPHVLGFNDDQQVVISEWDRQYYEE